MSLPTTRPASPEQPSSLIPTHTHLPASFAKRQYTRTSIPLAAQRSPSPASNRLPRRLLAGGAGHLPSSLRTFEDGIRHYERVRSPSLRGHSRRGSWSDPPPPPSSSPARPLPQAINPVLSPYQPSKTWSLKEWCSDHGSPSLDVSTSEVYDFDLADEVGEETLQPIKLDHYSDDDSDSSWSDHQADDEDPEGDFDSDGGGGRTSMELPRSVRIFKVGERLGVGTMHQGHRVRDLFEPGPGNGRRLSMGNDYHGLGTGLLEIVRQIGVGSYAVVYLVREVLHDPDLTEHRATADHSLPTSSSSSADALSETPKASDGFANMLSPALTTTKPPRRRRRHRGEPNQVIYGRDFALKCLCKRDLSDEHLLLQRGEAELHRALPLHENIVALHRALETPNWLFLVIEYCPGQDLFYWLEQARDSQDLESLASRASSVSQQLCPPSHTTGYYTPPPSTLLPPSTSTVTPLSARQPYSSPSPPLSPKPINFDYSHHVHPSPTLALPINTPPSPSLLASRADDEMLSRRRLRLISRMFVQMCEAVEACHRVGVCHRDIKPENFIVLDSRRSRSPSIRPIPFSLLSNTRGSDSNISIPELSGIPSSVVVKITDWGLGTSSSACEDFDCGSKPYMAYECRNNLNPTYDPVQADVWSLGIVLLNLLYHRCPWADPTLSDPAFVEFRRAPIAFLHDRFEGMTAEVATFLATKVFCEVGSSTSFSGRVTAGELGEWSKNLLSHMGGGQLHASASGATFALSPSSARASQQFSDHRSGSGRRVSLSSNSAVAHAGGGPSKRSSQLFQAISLPHSVPEDLSPLDSVRSHISRKSSDTNVGPNRLPLLQAQQHHTNTVSSHCLSPLKFGEHLSVDRQRLKTLELNDRNRQFNSLPHIDPSLLPHNHNLEPQTHVNLCDSRDGLKEKLEELELSGSTVAIMTDDLESVTSSAGKQSRRKRGARKGRKPEDSKRLGCDTAPVSPAEEDSDFEHISYQNNHHHHLDGLAQASQILAREISQASKSVTVPPLPPSSSSSTKMCNNNKIKPSSTTTAPVVKRKLNLAERMMEKFRDGGNPDFQAFAARARAREQAYLGVAVGGVGAGKNANTVSAPAQLQQARQITSSSGFSSVSQSTTHTSTSTSTSSGGSGWVSSSGCGSAPSSGPWISASVRRDRLQSSSHQQQLQQQNQASFGGGGHEGGKPLDRPSGGGGGGGEKDGAAEPKTKLAALLTSFKRFNSTVANPGSNSSNGHHHHHHHANNAGSAGGSSWHSTPAHHYQDRRC